MTTGDFDLYYSTEPFSGLQTNQREWYDPILRDYWNRSVTYNNFVSTQFNLNGVQATSMTMTSLIPPHPNFNPIGLRTMWLPSSYMDSKARTIQFNRYAAKLSLNRYDQAITYWQTNPAGGLRALVDKYIGPMFTAILERVARNTFFTNPYKLIGATGTGSSFASITGSDTLSSSIIEDIHLGMGERGVPYASGPNGREGTIVCVTTPGVVRKIRESTSNFDWQDVMKYADPMRIVNGEIGSWKGVRFVQTNDACLYNTGTISKQVNIAAAINAGDGASPHASPVDDVWKVGQPSGVTNYIQCSAFSEGEFAVNDIVTLHVSRTNANGITNGVDYTDGKLINRRVVALDQPNARLVFDEPIMEDWTTNLGSGVYGYVTKGRHVHTATFIGGNDGVVMGVNQAPRIHTPGVIDDLEMMYRIAMDAYLGYQLYEPTVYEVWYGAGMNRYKGATVS